MDKKRGVEALPIKNNLIRICGLCLLLLPAAVQAQEYDKRWYMGGYGGWIALDSARHSHDDTMVGGGFGRFWGQRWSVDIEFESYNTHYDQEYLESRGRYGWNGQNRVKDLQFVGRYYFRESGFRPYVSFGAGLQRHRNSFDDGGSPTALAGLGAHYMFGNYVGARIQAYYKTAFGNDTHPETNTLSDIIYRLDLLVYFGKPR